ncbi:hypothetical protein DL93DRAFT_856030 [Clavulina sp. PMI_390]|nr:hypothetical protein DL93DRAFT_856030 [Clavulina sp. PMI_390]
MSAQHGVPTIVRFDNNPQHFDTSLYVNRLEALLTFSKSPYDIDSQAGNPQTAPRGKLPYIKLGQETIPDSLFGYEELVRRGLASELDVGLTPKDLATSRAITSLVQELFVHVVMERWIDQFYYAREKALGHLWYPLRVMIAYFIYRSISSSGRAMEFGRPAHETDTLRQTAIDALATWVGEKKHVLGGDAPTRVDAIVFGLIAAVHADLRWNPKHAASFHAHPNLREYAEGLRKTWYPDRPSFLAA